MTDDDLLEMALAFRSGIIGEGGSSEAMCFAISAPLASLLSCYGVDCELAKSDHSKTDASPWYEHFWIRLADGRALDPTFDQLCEDADPVYIGPPTEFHITDKMEAGK